MTFFFSFATPNIIIRLCMGKIHLKIRLSKREIQSEEGLHQGYEGPVS